MAGRRLSAEELRSCSCTRTQLAKVEFAAGCPLHGLDSPLGQTSNRKLVQIAGEFGGVAFSARCEFLTEQDFFIVRIPKPLLRPMHEIMKAIAAEGKARG